MSGELAITRTAAMIADPARAEMLLAMMDGRAYPASDLAAFAHVSPSTASHHLSGLVGAGLVEVFRSGKHRYHRLAGSQVAELLESIGALDTSRKPTRAVSPRASALANCRTCYDHLAGRLGVELRKSLERQEMIELDGDRYTVTATGREFFTPYGITLSDRQPQAKACLDWTERTPHIGAWLGRAILRAFLERHWLQRGELPRSLIITPMGEERLAEDFGIHTTPVIGGQP
jgi:DNA-binding transcriptional ArsR family regulator